MALGRTLQMPFRSIQRVYFDDLDALNILHNVRFLLFMERARGELFNELGFRWEDDLQTNPDKYHVDVIHADGTTRLVRLDPATQKPCSWSDRFRAAFGPLVKAP